MQPIHPSSPPRGWSAWLAAALLAVGLACQGVPGIAATPAAAAPATAPAAAAPAAAAPAAPVVPVSSNLVQMPDGRLLAPDIARIVNRGELLVAMLGVDTPPFFYEKNGELVGLEVDLAKAIAKELGVPVKFNRTAKTFNAVVDRIARGEADLAISKLSRTLARAQVISFSAPYLRLNHSLMLNRVQFAQFARDRPLPEVVRGFKGTVGVIAKSSFSDYAQRYFPNAKIVEYPGWGEVLKALEKGDVMSAYRDEFEVKRILKIDPTASLVMRTVTFKDLEDTLGIGVGVGDPTLLAFVNEFLSQRSDKLTINKVLQALEQ